MNSIAKHVTKLFKSPNYSINSLSSNHNHNHHHVNHQLRQIRGIRVKVMNGNLEQALTLLQRKMQTSGIERLSKHAKVFHMKNSEKRILARKNLERRLRSEDFARKLKTILIKKVRGM